MSLPEDRRAALPALDWDASQSRFLFFTGKGGVGKTTTASALALRMAEAGGRVLAVSTDPASNLDDVFETQAGEAPTPVEGVENLAIMNIDPEAAASAYREAVVGPYRGVLPDSAVASMEEQLSGACTVEIAAFNQFTGLLADGEITGNFDHVVFDTAPTGHTLRLLSLPSAWDDYMQTSGSGASCLGPLSELGAQQEEYAETVRILSDADLTTVVLVARPEGSALREAARAGEELAELGIANQRLVVNGVFSEVAEGDEVAEALLSRQSNALAGMPESFANTPAHSVPLVASNLTGVNALRVLSGSMDAQDSAETFEDVPPDELPEDLDALIAGIESDGSGVVLTMGKGGVGKTTLAAAIAVTLAGRGHKVHLSTTDPAAHLADTLGGTMAEKLEVGKIDPETETARYAEEVIAAAGELDEEGRALLEEDLRSPCTEEIAVFRAFARTVDDAEDAFVILDTAPTGHTLLLLDAAQSYHKEVERTTGQVPESVKALLPRLRDPRFAKVVITTLAESTPVHEAERLQADLRRARIEPYGWVVNSCFSASGTAHPLLSRRANLELPHLRRVSGELASRSWWVPWLAEAPTGEAGLLALSSSAS